MKQLELKVPPVALVAITAAAMGAVAYISPGLHLTIPGTAWLAACIAITGVFIAILGVLQFRAAGTTVDPRLPDQSATLVVRGIYRYSRNPMYVGLFLLLCGWAVLLESVLGFLLLPLFVLYMTRFQIVPEERFMREKFGEAYQEYSSEVRRWV